MLQLIYSSGSEFQKQRLHRRLLLHHLPLLALSAISVAALYFTRPYKDVVMKASFATAYPALILLAATLAIGPFNILTRRRNPVSLDFRRDLGIWAGILAVIHTVIGQNVHLRGRPWLYYVYERGSHHFLPIRHDVFGLANYTGAFCTLVVLLLLATSNDYSLRRLGTRSWKKLQRWNYAAFALLAIHALAYEEGIEHQKLPFLVITIAGLALALILQLCGFALRRLSNPSRAQITIGGEGSHSDSAIAEPSGNNG
ncbi:MAG TPA: ferric reductase-like transmembrane domain-containing protein [Terracidiphilus sp.]